MVKLKQKGKKAFSMSNNKSPIEPVTKFAAHLSAVEIVIGSFLHGFKIPFGGHFLSLNQGYFLCRFLNEIQTRSSHSRLQSAQSLMEVSGVAACLKSLSPAGQKVGPMLSLSMQGLLFATGVLLGGIGSLGQFLGFTLLILWAFVQPFLSLFVLYGSNFEKMLHFYFERVQNEWPELGISLAVVFTTVVLIKWCLSLFLLFLAKKTKTPLESVSLLRPFSEYTKQTPHTSAFRGALRDLTRPLFLFSFLLLVIFLSLTESTKAEVVWLSLRPLALGFLLFYILRSHWFYLLLEKGGEVFPWMGRLRSRALAARDYMDQILSKKN